MNTSHRISKWSSREQEFARLFASLPNAEVAARLGTTVAAVKGKACRMGLHKGTEKHEPAKHGNGRAALRREISEPDDVGESVTVWHDPRQGFGRVLVHRIAS